MLGGGGIEAYAGFHDDVKASIRPEQKCEVGVLRAAAGTGNVENFLRVFEEGVQFNDRSMNVSASPMDI